MSQPRRRRRRRGSRRGGGAKPPRGDQQKQAVSGGEAAPTGRRRRRRRRRGRAPSGPRTLEEVIDGLAPRPEGALTLPEDELDLDDIIGSLQAKWGVPVYPQEYRLTIKVADDKNGTAAGKSASRGGAEREGIRPGAAGIPREKAPAAPRMPRDDAGEDDGGGGSRRRRRRRRARRGGGRGGDPGA
jgi:hypothetical protein